MFSSNDYADDDDDEDENGDGNQEERMRTGSTGGQVRHAGLDKIRGKNNFDGYMVEEGTLSGLLAYQTEGVEANFLMSALYFHISTGIRI